MMACLCPCIGSYDIKKHRYQFKVSFRIYVKEIRFKRNDYFLKNSHYNFYSKGAFRRKIKGTVEVEDINALAKLPVDGMMKIYGTLSQSMQGKYTNRYKPLIKRIMVRQITTVSRYDEIYKTIGHIELPLHELVKLKEPKEFMFPLIDEEEGVDAMVRIVVERKLKNDPYAGSLLFRTGKYFGHEIYNMIFPQDIPDVPTRLEHNQHYFDVLRQRDNSEFKEQIIENDQQRILRREFEKKKALEAKRLAAGLPLNTETDGNLTPMSNSSPSNNRKSNKMTRTTTEEELQKLQFSEDDFDDKPAPIRLARISSGSPANKNTVSNANNNDDKNNSGYNSNNNDNINNNAMIRKHSNNSNVSNANTHVTNTSSNNPYVPYYMLESSHTSSHNSSNNNIADPNNTNISSSNNAYNELKTVSSDSHDRLPVRKVTKRPSGVRAAQQQQQLQLLQQQQQLQNNTAGNNNIYGIASKSYGSSTSLSPQHTPNGGSKSFNYDDVYGAENNDDRFDSAYPSNTNITSSNNNNTTVHNNNNNNFQNQRSRFAEAYQQQYEEANDTNDYNNNNNAAAVNNNGYYATNPYRAVTANIYASRSSLYNNNATGNTNNSMYGNAENMGSGGSVSGGFTAPKSSASPSSSAYNMTSNNTVMSPSVLPLVSSTGVTPRKKGRIAESGVNPTPSPSLNNNSIYNSTNVTPPKNRLYANNINNGDYSYSNSYGNGNNNDEYVRSGASVGSYNRRMSSGYFESPRSYNNSNNTSLYDPNNTGTSSNPIEARIVKRLSQQGQSFYGQQYISALEKNSSGTPNNNNSYFAQPNYNNQGYSGYEEESIHSYPSQQPSLQQQQQPVIRKKVRRIAESPSSTPSNHTILTPPAASNSSYTNNNNSRPASGNYNAHSQSNNISNYNTSKYNDTHNNNNYNNSNYNNNNESNPNSAYPKHPQYTISTHYSTIAEDNTPSYAQHALYQPYSPLGASYDSEMTSPSLNNASKGRSNHSNNQMWQNLPLQTLGQRYNSVGGNAINTAQTANNLVQSPSNTYTNSSSTSNIASASQDQSSKYFAPVGYYQDR